MARVQLFFDDESRTQQSFKSSCDVNVIMKRFKKVMGVDYLTKMHGYAGGEFGDFSDVPDYRTSLEQVRQAKGMFDSLPAIVRKRFSNDAALFLDFVHDPRNEAELVEMGLANAKVIAPIDNIPPK